MALSKIPSAGFQDNVKFRNIIINGDMSIAQRGTSSTGITGSATYNTCDRWITSVLSLGTWTNTQSTDVPSGQGFSKSFKMDCTTADASPSAGDYCMIQQRFEGQNLQYLKKGTSSAEQVTLSFWVKSNKTGTYVAQLEDTDNNRSTSKSYTINSSNTWEKKTITYDADTTGAFDNDNGLSLVIEFWLGAGSTYTSGTLATSWESTTPANRAVGQVNLADSTSNEWLITGVQLEAGETASDFEFLPHDVNQQRCFRYYYKINADVAYQKYAHGFATSTTQQYMFCNFPVEMRAAPSTLDLSATNLYTIWDGVGSRTVSSISYDASGKFFTSLTVVGSGYTDTQSGILQSAGNTSSYMGWGAEL